jgi:hypothetical protein
MQPSDIGLLSRVHSRLNTSVHAFEDRLFVRDTLQWRSAAFTSLILRSPDTFVLAAADRLDVALHDHFPTLREHCHSALLVVDRPETS